MMNILTQEGEFTFYKKSYKKHSILKDQTVQNPSLFIFLGIHAYISFKEIKNLLRNLLSLNCQQLPQKYKNLLLPNFQKFSFLRKGFTEGLLILGQKGYITWKLKLSAENWN